MAKNRDSCSFFNTAALDSSSCEISFNAASKALLNYTEAFDATLLKHCQKRGTGIEHMTVKVMEHMYTAICFDGLQGTTQ